MTFKKILINKKNIPLILEIVPPNKNITAKELDIFINKLKKIIKKTKIKAIDIPDLIPEPGIKRKKGLEKIKPRILAREISKKIKIPIIINRVTVFNKLNDHKKWLIDSYNNYNIRNIIFVGAPDDKKYKGLSVPQAAKLANQLNKKKQTNILTGGITIPTRKNEVTRIIKKQKAGVKYFLSQIIYEAETIKRLLKKYYKECQKEKIKPATFLLSFSPISSSNDINFLKSLGVLIPKKTEKDLLKNKKAISKNSIIVINKIFNDINKYLKKENIKIPLAIVVAYIKKENLITVEKLCNSFIKKAVK